MAAAHDLKQLLSGMSPSLDADIYVFVTLPNRAVPPGLAPRMIMQEREGTTLILTQAAAKAADLAYVFPCRMITLNVHSALNAVGFLAHITTRLAALGMAVNPVAGYFHDHLFVPADRAQEAMSALHALSSEAHNETL